MEASPRTPTDAPARTVAPWLILLVVCIGQYMVVLDVSIVNVALPAIQRSLHFTEANLQWVITAYAVTFGGLLLFGGRMGDLFGRKRIFLLGLVLFTAASAVGGFADNSTTLIAARALQGVGGAVLSPATMTIIAVTFTEPAARAKAFGVWSAVAAGGGASGALIGGVLLTYLSWRWILFVNVPVGIAALLLASRFLTESRREGARERLDVAGSVSVTVGMLALVYGITGIGQHPSWSPFHFALAFGAAVVFLATFAVVELNVASHPVFPFRLLRSRSITGSNLAMLFFASAMFAMWYFVTLFLQEILGFSAMRTGFAFIPQTVAIAASATVAGKLVPRLGARNVVLIGAVLSAVGLGWLSFAQPGQSFWAVAFGGGVLTAAGLGFATPPLAVAATHGVAPQESGLASGILNSSRQLGAAIGLAILATLATDHTTAALHGASGMSRSGGVLPGALHAFSSGYTLGFRWSAVICVVAAAATLIIPSHRPNAVAPAASPDAEAATGAVAVEFAE